MTFWLKSVVRGAEYLIPKDGYHRTVTTWRRSNGGYFYSHKRISGGGWFPKEHADYIREWERYYEQKAKEV